MRQRYRISPFSIINALVHLQTHLHAAHPAKAQAKTATTHYLEAHTLRARSNLYVSLPPYTDGYLNVKSNIYIYRERERERENA